jgi:hypothetical protein
MCKAAKQRIIFFKVANATRFDFIWFYTMVLVREHMTYIILLGNFRCGCILKMAESLLG